MSLDIDAAESLGKEGSPEADRHLAENFGMTVRQVRDFDPQTLDATRACKFLGLPPKRFDQLASQPEARGQWVESVARQKKDLIETFPQAGTELKGMLEAIRKFALRKCLKPDGPALVDKGGTARSNARSATKKVHTQTLAIGGGVIVMLLLVGGLAAVLISARGGPEKQATAPAGGGPGRDVQPGTGATGAAGEKSRQKKERAAVSKSGESQEGGGIADGEREQWTPLFNGKDLTGWKSYGKPTWAWVDGRLVGTIAQDKSPGFLMTEAGYTDFEIELEYKAGTGIGSGLFLRGVSDGPVSGAEQLEIQIMDDSDNSFPARQTYKTGSVFAAFARKAEPKIMNGDWNALRVKLYGRKIEVWVNGTQTVEADLDNARSQFGKFPGLARASGRIGLQQNQHADVQFRNVRVKKFDGTDLGGAWPANGFTPLFNGKDLAGWKQHPDTTGKWGVEDGIIVGRGVDQSHLFTEDNDYADFHVRVEAKINTTGNSGVCFRTNYFGLGKVQGKGYEANIEGDGSRRWQTGSLMHITPNGEVVKPLVGPGEWFEMEVIAVGKQITIKVNGKVTVDIADSNSTYNRGCIALQQLGDSTDVRFRKVEVKKLPPSK